MIVWVMGPTGAGKSTFLNFAKSNYPTKVGLVEVGKIMRAKYPPDYFKGQAAPQHTQEEAWQLCEEGIFAHVKDNKELILVDGQPRSVHQFDCCMTRFTSLHRKQLFLYLDAPQEIRRTRLMSKYLNDSGSLELAMLRLQGDVVAYVPVLTKMLENKVDFMLEVTSSSCFDPAALVQKLLRGA